MTTMERLVSTAEAARIKGVSIGTINRYVREGVLTPYVKAPGPRGAHLYRLEDVLALEPSTRGRKASVA